MNPDALQSEVDLGGGRLALYPGRLVHRSEAVTETVPLSQLASVRIAFEREAGKLGGAVALGTVAALLFAVAAPLRNWLAALAGKTVPEPGARESLETVLQSVFSALAAVAGAFPALAFGLLVVGAALVALWWYGRTTLTLCFAATERAFAVRGRNSALLEFAEALGSSVAELTRNRGG